MNPSTDPRLDPCGCCEAGVPQPRLFNRPGLSALAYRIGTHPTFLRRMLVRLPSQLVPPDDPSGTRPLTALTTRASDDPAIALLDAWSTVADVLTFYQERIANEGYLRTATERRSVLELARTIGYELKPGVAASAFLVFTVEEAPDAPGVATVPKGTKAQSIPGQGQLPQTFETSAEITARAEWNALRPRLTRPQELAIRRDQRTEQDKLYLLGISTSFALDTSGVVTIPVDEVYPLDPTLTLPPGPVPAMEVQQLYLAGTNTNLKAGDLLLLVGKRNATDIKTLVLPIKRVEVEAELKRTRLDFVDKPPKPTFAPLFLESATIQLDVLTFNETQVNRMIVGQTWRERDLTAFLSIQDWRGRNLIRHIHTPPAPKLPPADAGIFGFRVRSSPFGHNAPRWDSLPLNLRYPEENKDKPVPYPAPGWDGGNEPNIIVNSRGGTYQAAYGVDFFAERTLPEVTKDGWLILESPTQRAPYRVAAVTEASLADFSLSAKATGIRVETVANSAALTTFKIRSTTIHAGSQSLELADLPIEDLIAADTTSLQLDRMVLGLQVDQPLVLNGERADLPGVTSSEVVILTDIRHSGGYTTLFFKDPLQYSYVRKTVTINANVVEATHGETVTEVLGSGDGAQPNPRFTLKKPPLTYVSAATASGAQSILHVRVNGVLWQEAPRLYGLDGRSENYIVRIEDDGKTRVIFGDGKMGARLPTGTENVVTTYRSGIGLPGMVGADKLTLLQTRPLGIRSVTNPLPASGAAEPENRDSARTNAPLTVLTLERIVSLRDYEDFARGFAGIGKAQAVALWQGDRHVVHLTVAAAAPTTAPDGEDATSSLATHVIEPTSSLFTNLVEAIRGASDPGQPFVVASYQPLFFNVKAKVLVNPRYTPATVLAAVETALKAAFSFEQRTFGQPVTAAEVVMVIQSVPGVVATDLDQLYRYRDDEAPPPPEAQITPEVLEVEPVRQVGDKAQLLLINPVGITLEEMKP